jgi:hypothetical protein
MAFQIFPYLAVLGPGNLKSRSNNAVLILLGCRRSVGAAIFCRMHRRHPAF